MKEARQLIEEELQRKEKEVLQKNAKKVKRQDDDVDGHEEEEWDVVPHRPAASGGQPKGNPNSLHSIFFSRKVIFQSLLIFVSKPIDSLFFQ